MRARPEDSWPIVPTNRIRCGDVVMLPTAIDGARVLRSIGPLRVASIRRRSVDGHPFAVIRWTPDGLLILSGRLYAAGARREPPQEEQR